MALMALLKSGTDGDLDGGPGAEAGVEVGVEVGAEVEVDVGVKAGAGAGVEAGARTTRPKARASRVCTSGRGRVSARAPARAQPHRQMAARRGRVDASVPLTLKGGEEGGEEKPADVSISGMGGLFLGEHSEKGKSCTYSVSGGI
eukprot:687535-Pelagomonas_calceolata.AAC.2